MFEKSKGTLAFQYQELTCPYLTLASLESFCTCNNIRLNIRLRS